MQINYLKIVLSSDLVLLLNHCVLILMGLSRHFPLWKRKWALKAAHLKRQDIRTRIQDSSIFHISAALSDSPLKA